jgi:hypothetical protein
MSSAVSCFLEEKQQKRPMLSGVVKCVVSCCVSSGEWGVLLLLQVLCCVVLCCVVLCCTAVLCCGVVLCCAVVL